MKVSFFLCFALIGLSPLVHADLSLKIPSVKEEIHTDPEFNTGRYILPNESDNHLYYPALHGLRGACISVGTFRGLNLLAGSDCSILIQLDLDATSTEFNRVNAELIMHSKDRQQYLSFLQGKSMDQIPSNLRSRLALVLNHAHLTALSLFEGLVSNHADPYSWRETIFGSDDAFKKVKKLIQEKKVFALNGSISGKETLKALSRELKANHIPVSVLDVSNILDYFTVRPGNASYTLAYLNFLENMHELGFDKNAMILFTSNYLSFPKLHSLRPNMNWDYIAWPVDDFLHESIQGWRRKQDKTAAYHRISNTYSHSSNTGLVVPDFHDHLKSSAMNCSRAYGGLRPTNK